VAVYLLLGLLWGVWYEIIELLQPGSFAVASQKAQAGLPQLAYFSFTTLTTLGFGDIVPLSPLARSLVILEALVGQLFPVILIARLVTIEIDPQRGNVRRESARPIVLVTGLCRVEFGAYFQANAGWLHEHLDDLRASHIVVAQIGSL
jgi:Ion channel